MDVQRLIETSSQAAAGWPPPPCPLLREEGSRGWFPSWFRPSAHRFPMNAGGESRLVPSWFRRGPGGGHHPLTPSSERRGVAAGSPPGSGGGQGVATTPLPPPPRGGESRLVPLLVQEGARGWSGRCSRKSGLARELQLVLSLPVEVSSPVLRAALSDLKLI